MRMLLNIQIPNEPFSTLVREGRIGDLMRKILDDMKPEAIYFTEQQGKRGAVAVVEVADASAIPALAEPWFLTLDADCELRIAMLPEDLMKAGLDALGDKWK
ncbi:MULTISPECIES: panthothenate synthetase [Paraburkholderia]|uniref:Panthothenate synthetase n=1 Tax=Paraburkholderia podalyriae TaxID=1938811 RepID=A0ABR7PN97_9BURK|nr:MULTISPECIES: panthothenate synthetase [Paraburkholderia]MBC8726276.1 panthothenate synthetase [Paraburkholderia sp. 31.1]MBC8747353.1 panthothenate synthetase [Paraburkholderia podalyriae]